MLKFGVIVLLMVYPPTTVATTCDACKSTYGTDKGNAADNAAKCVVLADYLTCLETSGKDDAGCPLAAVDAAAIETDYGTLGCGEEAAFTDTCKCQKDFWKTDQSADNAAICSAATAYIACLKGKTAMACDTSTTVAALATGVETRMTNLGSTDCAVTTTCQCEIQAAKADISTAAKKCTAYKTELNCLRTSQSAGCDATSTKSAIATATDALRGGLGASDCPALTATCQCEVDAAKGDASTSAKYCTVLTNLKSCLTDITTAAEIGCTTLTQAVLVTDTDNKIAEAKCENAADHMTFAMTSLIVSVVANMFL